MESGEGHKKRKDVGRQEEGVVTASELELELGEMLIYRVDPDALERFIHCLLVKWREWWM